MRKILDYFNGVLVLLMFLVIFIQILARLVIKVPTSWSVEAGGLFYIFVVFLGIASITRTDSHLRVDVIYNYFPGGLKKIVSIISVLLILLFLFLFSVGAYRNILANWKVGIPTIEWFKWGYVYLVILVGSVLNMFYYFLNLISWFKRKV
jgi:TRAP-type C4-dicarboxylate transport system permease small subunit